MEQIVFYFCNTLIHRGKILENIVRKLYPDIADLTRKLGYGSRTTIYRHFEKPDLDDGIILKYGQAIGYEFKKEFPELYTYMRFNDPDSEYGKTREELTEEVKIYKDLYYKQLEEVNRLLQEILELKRKTD